MVDIEKRKKEILAKLGPEIQILKEAGMDVDERIDTILKQQEAAAAMRDLKTAVPTPDNSMTSELVYRSEKLESFFGNEYARRLNLLGLSNEQIKELYEQESQIISGSPNLDAQRQGAWVRRSFIDNNTTPETLPKPEELTLSELILITDDANYVVTSCGLRSQLPPKAFEALRLTAASRGGEGCYIHVFYDRRQALGWSQPQYSAFIRNESLLTEKFKWGRHNNPAWVGETTDLKKYER